MNGFSVENAGLQSSIQDAGRRGFGDIGLTQSGAMDELAFAYANMLVGNPFNTPVIEIALGGLALKAHGVIRIAVCGAAMNLTCKGKPLALWQTHTLQKGDVLSFAFASDAQFAYLAVQGGFQTPYAYGSFSTSLKEGLGGIEGRKLKAGDFLDVKETTVCHEVRKLKSIFIPTYSDEITLRLLKGYQEALFTKEAQKTFFSTAYTFKGEGDRMGYRLSGEKVVPRTSGILSEPICYGAVQVPSHGEPIVLLKERQTIGGYPKIGSVIAVDCFKLAQLKAGGRVRFCEVSLEEAQEATQTFYRFCEEVGAD
ncbi:biotin-dependent carboxyltransferase family protein [Sulfurospirillum barnesii]|uniref:Biotin-dependent carboxylase-like protein n=1 Tax=Sulfurospirillum barnesii (strain ATCC 700032 / DSM 10660 / SES-3) TaxID=760154 RepID=I3XZ27_SULBS|nr:biotin-dependent carboxyltransferase family protein [Sulfurospirillum barnesii]AFL69201.1 biotin-dependent carboxylase-like protein [Sulfurospirillum barnesii SES-3]